MMCVYTSDPKRVEGKCASLFCLLHSNERTHFCLLCHAAHFALCLTNRYTNRFQLITNNNIASLFSNFYISILFFAVADYTLGTLIIIAFCFVCVCVFALLLSCHNNNNNSY